MDSKPSISSTSSSRRSVSEVRARIDAIDARLHEALLERMDYMRELAELKREDVEGQLVYRPGREARLLRRRVAAHRGEMSLTTLVQIWREVISESLRVQQTLNARALPVILVSPKNSQQEETLASARGWAGAGAAIKIMPKLEDFFAQMDGDPATIGLVPVALPGAWWQSMSNKIHGNIHRKIHIVARWPFIAATHIAPLYVLANMLPEDSGADRSLYAQDEKIVEIEGFVLPDDATAPSGHFLGCYARALDE